MQSYINANGTLGEEIPASREDLYASLLLVMVVVIFAITAVSLGLCTCKKEMDPMDNTIENQKNAHSFLNRLQQYLVGLGKQNTRILPLTATGTGFGTFSPTHGPANDASDSKDQRCLGPNCATGN